MDLEIKKGVFEFNQKNAIVPNSLAISYALSIATSGLSNKIIIAGFDGYTKNNPKKNLVDEVFSNYFSSQKHLTINTITPSLYKIKNEL